MADYLLSPLVDAIVGKLEESIKEIKLRWGIDEEIKNLSSTLSTIQAVLQDAEEQQVTSNEVKDWLRKLKDVAYDADDVVEEFATDVLRLKLEGGNQFRKRKHQLYNFFSALFNSISFLSRDKTIVQKIKEIQERLDKIAKERHDLHLKQEDGGRRREIKRQSLTSSLINESNIFGRDKDKEKIVKLLLGESASSSSSSSSSKDISVIPIVGIGGLGKTTLAQFIYNDKRVGDHFSGRGWVCVSEDFDMCRLTKAIMESVTKNSCDLNEIDPLQVRLKEELSGKRFLLVLDDVWNENHSDWDRLQSPFSSGANGSRIIITTRSSEVSRIMGTIPVYNLGCLDEDDSWSLFTRRAFIVGSSDVPPNLVAIGKKIVKKCNGLPLAIEALGGLLRSNTDENKWKYILESELWEISKMRNDIIPILKFSYDHLPACLKQCFVYCSLFPKDYEFDKVTLIQLWIAEGFIQSDRRTRLEDICSEYFDFLMSRSFFQYFERSYGSRYKMHDLIHDLAQSVSGDEYFRIKNSADSWNIAAKVRHASVWQSNEHSGIFESFHESERLRTFLLPPRYETLTKQVAHDFFLKLRCLRVLDLANVWIRDLPDSIGELKYFRYLDLSHTNIATLPESIGSLYNLQTLKLCYCEQLAELPKSTSNLINLRHLALEGCKICTPPELGKLISLQTLTIFVVGKESGCGIRELKNLTELRGNIHISNLENVIDGREGKEANLKKKEYLDELTLEWSNNNPRVVAVDEEVLEGLQPHTNLKTLKILSYGGVSFPRWMMSGNLTNLTTVSLVRCLNCQQLPPLGQLAFLKKLKINGMDGLKHIEDEFIGGSNKAIMGFPLLEELELVDMPNLEEWCGAREGDMPCLGTLKISKCPKLQRFPHLPCINNLELGKCNEMVLALVPCLTTLKSLRIGFIEGLISLPPGLLQPLTALEELAVTGCNELVSWPKEVGLHDLPSLQYLEIYCCPKLESLEDDEEGLPITLRSLKISNDCDSLKCMPTRGLGKLGSLQRLDLVTQCTFLPEEELPITLQSLKIFSCSNLKSMSKGIFSNLTSLKELVIRDCPQLESLTGEGELPTALTSLWISDCPNLKSLAKGMRNNLTSLEQFYINKCPQLESLPNIIGLRRMTIRKCPLMQQFPEGTLDMLTSLSVDNGEIFSNKLTSLQTLNISECSQLEFSPTMLLPPTLKFLRINSCDNLKSLPNGMLKNLTSLKQLTIAYCPQLLSLPEEGLPTTLQRLYIYGCSEVEKQCHGEVPSLALLSSKPLSLYFSPWILPSSRIPLYGRPSQVWLTLPPPGCSPSSSHSSLVDDSFLLMTTTKLDGSNYLNWNVAVETYLIAKRKIHIIHRDPPTTAYSTYEQWEQDDAHIRTLLSQSMTTQILGTLMQLPTAKTIWDHTIILYSGMDDLTRICATYSQWMHLRRGAAQ
ncbi:putative disease resistance protein RGA3 [Tasmannia lanceolata]|uniref:putative disease resistance protein RGA3 n=1 Tax=Tasmannia lanceolata TaxID=3420 RepID=UPI00406450F0